jgi:membrane associated rhomboid family serine protease
MMPLTPWVKRLIIANVVVYVLTRGVGFVGIPPLVDMRPLILFPDLSMVRHPWTLVTYMFLHASLGHIFFNMLGLFFLGPRLEDRLGGKSFLWLYFISGIGGAVASFMFASQYPVIGASAGVFGVVIGFVMYWPHERLILFPIPIPMPAWFFGALYVGGSLFMIKWGLGGNIAHFAHLGGVAFGFGYLKYRDWRRGASRRAFQKKMTPQSSAGVSDRIAVARWKGISMDGLHEINREEVERLLAKVDADGSRSLTPAEREFLDRMAGT